MKPCPSPLMFKSLVLEQKYPWVQTTRCTVLVSVQLTHWTCCQTPVYTYRDPETDMCIDFNINRDLCNSLQTRRVACKWPVNKTQIPGWFHWWRGPEHLTSLGQDFWMRTETIFIHFQGHLFCSSLRRTLFRQGKSQIIELSLWYSDFVYSYKDRPH